MAKFKIYIFPNRNRMKVLHEAYSFSNSNFKFGDSFLNKQTKYNFLSHLKILKDTIKEILC